MSILFLIMKYLIKTTDSSSDRTSSDERAPARVPRPTTAPTAPPHPPPRGGLRSDYVDLGLPSGLLWAKKNLGAATEEDAGLYFQWGDTVGYTAEHVGVDKQFNWNDYKFSIDGSSSNFSKYNSTDGKTVLDLEDDAVRVAMGGNWRMPTNEDFQELINNTDLYLVPESGTEIHGNINSDTPSYASIYFEWEQQPSGTIKGMKFYKKSDSSVYMFVPAVGVAVEGPVQGVGEGGALWSSSLGSQSVLNAWNFLFEADGGGVGDGGGCRFGGLPLRGVSTK